MIDKLQQFVRRFVSDASFRQDAIADPEKAVSLFGLAGPERHGALQLCAQAAGPVEAGPAGTWW